MDTSLGWLLIQDIRTMTACVRKMDVGICPIEPHNSDAKANYLSEALQCLQINTVAISNAVGDRDQSFFISFTLFGVETACANRSAAGNGTAPFCVEKETFCLNCTYTI